MGTKTNKRRNNVSRGSPPTAVFVSLVGAAGLILWFLRKKRHENSEKLPDKDSNNKNSQVKKSNRSPFKFPAGTGGKATTAATAGLPRNKASSNKKKNKAKRRAEKAEKAQRKEEQSSKKGSVSQAGDGKSDQSTTSVINYSYFDSARRDTIIPTHKKPSLTAADVMKKDQEKQ